MQRATTFPYIVILDTGEVEQTFEYWNLANAKEHIFKAKKDGYFSGKIMHEGLVIESWENE